MRRAKLGSTIKHYPLRGLKEGEGKPGYWSSLYKLKKKKKKKKQ